MEKARVFFFLLYLQIAISDIVICKDYECDVATDISLYQYLNDIEFVKSCTFQFLTSGSGYSGKLESTNNLEEFTIIDMNFQFFNTLFGTNITYYNLEGDTNLKSIISGSTLPEKIFEQKAFIHKFGKFHLGKWSGISGSSDSMSLGCFRVTPEFLINDYKFNFMEIEISGLRGSEYYQSTPLTINEGIRSYLVSLALEGLNIPTSIPLAISSYPYEGTERTSQFTLAPSFLRFGTFELLHKDGAVNKLRRLVDTVIATYFPHFISSSEKQPTVGINNESHIQFLEEVVRRQAKLAALWRSVGFCHGLLDTDMISILGVTLPSVHSRFIDNFHPNFTCNNQNDPTGRYKFFDQQMVIVWNIRQFADSLSSLIDLHAQIKIITKFYEIYSAYLEELMSAKYGLPPNTPGVDILTSSLEEILTCGRADYHKFFRLLTKHFYATTPPAEITNLFADANCAGLLNYWWHFYQTIRSKLITSQQQQFLLMKTHNPLYVVRESIFAEAPFGGETLAQLRAVLSDPFVKSSSPLSSNLKKKLLG